MQVSHGHIESPEALEPDVNVNRTTASVMYNRSWGVNNWQTTLAWGRNDPSTGTTTDSYLLESAVTLSKTHTVFGRFERADKNELFLHGSPMADETFRVGKLSLGYVYDFPNEGHFKFGIGGLASNLFLPGELEPFYGSDPTVHMLFARVKIR